MRRVRVLHRSRSFGRELRVAEQIREELTDVIRSKMRDPRVETTDISLTEVRVTRDMAFADVYLQSLSSPDLDSRVTIVAVFEMAAGFLRTELAQRLAMRSTPQLRFHYDDTEEVGQRLDALIDRAMEREATVDGAASE